LPKFNASDGSECKINNVIVGLNADGHLLALEWFLAGHKTEQISVQLRSGWPSVSLNY